MSATMTNGGNAAPTCGANGDAFILGVAALVGAMAVPAAAAGQDSVTAFVHVAVIPMDRERLLRDQTVVVRGRRIVTLGPAKRVAVPAGAVRIDGTGKYLLPGLADMHVHSRAWFSFLASGITTVRNPGRSAGDGARARASVLAAKLPGPHVYAFGTVNTQLPAEAVQEVLRLKAAGDEAIKSVGLQPDVYDSVLAVARRAHLKIVGHVPRGRTLDEILDSGQWSSIEHLTGYTEYVIGLSGRADIGTYSPNLIDVFDQQSFVDTAAWMQPTFQTQPQLRTIAERTRQSGVWNCPTLFAGGIRSLLDVPDSMLARVGRKDVRAFRAAAQRVYDLSAAITKSLQDAGAGLLLGTDGGPFDAQRELQLSVQAGLTPYQALAMGTRNVASFWAHSTAPARWHRASWPI